MANPTIDNLVLNHGSILVLPDGDETSTTGTIFRRSVMGGGNYRVGSVSSGSEIEYDHVLFINPLATPVKIDDVWYLAMKQNAVVGLIP